MALSTYTINKILDWYMRGQTFTLPANFYVAFCSTTSSASAMGTELTGNAYARACVARSLTNFSGTQGQGTTTVSSGSTGIVYNNIQIDFTAPSAAWLDVLSVCIMDAPTGGNMLEYFNLGVSKKVQNAGDPVNVPINNWQTQITST